MNPSLRTRPDLAIDSYLSLRTISKLAYAVRMADPSGQKARAGQIRVQAHGQLFGVLKSACVVARR